MEGESARGWDCDLLTGTIGNASRTCHGKACGGAGPLGRRLQGGARGLRDRGDAWASSHAIGPRLARVRRRGSSGRLPQARLV